MGYWAKDRSYVREASDDVPRMTQGDSWEAEQRVIKGMQDWETQEQRRKQAEKEDRISYYETQKAIEQRRSDALRYERNQIEAINLIVEQKRQEYNKKSWFGKAIATLRGKTFKQMASEIEEYAAKRVENMSPSYLEDFIEENTLQEGRQR